MNQLNKKNSFEEILRDKQHKDRANEVFKLLAKQKRPANPFNKARSHTWNPSNEIKPGEMLNDTV